ncbi:MAG: BatA domain-containing protein [Chthoniobacteraceae bacterium]
MSFLAPLFLVGAAAIVGPILFHLIRRTTREVTPFSSLMFLQPTPPRVTKRSRIENLWLLLLRCLALALLALAFSRPFFARPASSLPLAEGAGKRTVILLDTSASMRRENLWPEARRKAEDLLRKAAPADEIAVLAFDRTARSVVSFEDWRAMKLDERTAATTQRLAALSPVWAGTQLDAALLRAAELLDQAAKDGPHPREIIVISDLQEGSRIDALQGYEWPRGLEVVLDPVRAEHLANASASWLAEADDANQTAEEAPPRLRVTSAAESKREQFQLKWGDAPPLNAYVPAGQSRIVRAPKAPADRALPLTLTGDETDFDNRLFLLPTQPVTLPIIFAGSDTDDDPRGSLYYLRRAFPKTRRQRVEITAHRSAEAIPAFQLQQAQLVIVGDGASDAALGSARQFARDGKTVVIPLASAAAGQTLGRLLEVPAFTTNEATVKDYAMLAQIDFQHPLFAPFADPRFSDFTKIHFWKYRRFDAATLPGTRVLARFDSGDPAITQTPLGKGNVVVFASSWRPLDSQLALSSKFVPLFSTLLEQSSNVPVPKAQYFVGDEVPLAPSPQPLKIRRPDGTETDATGVFSGTTEPGIYAITPGTQRFAVNLAPDESRLTPLPPERFTTLGVPLRKATHATPSDTAQREAQAQAAEIESRQKLWRWLLVAALVVLLLETLIAGRLSRLVAPPTEATP